MSYCKYYVYQFIDPRDNNIFYIGKGSGGRINVSHTTPALHRANPYLSNKIQVIQNSGCDYQKEIVAFFEREEDAYEYEIILIQESSLDGHSLCNLTDGGIGFSSGDKHPIHTCERFFDFKHRAKISAALTGNVLDNDHKHAIGLGVKKVWTNPIHREKMRLIALARRHSEDTKRKMSKIHSGEGNGMYGKKHSSDTKKKIGISGQKFSQHEVSMIRQLYSTGEYTQTALAKRFSCCRGTIFRIVYNKAYKQGDI